jgi:hypothetical protein
MLVFSQKAVIDWGAIAAQGRQHFDVELTRSEGSSAAEMVLELAHDHPFRGRFRVSSRRVKAEDQAPLNKAEARSSSWGMADLARRCSHVWEVQPDPGVSAAAGYYLAAILASVALGPLLPSDQSGLFGVRSCRLRADALSVGAGD